MDNESDPINDAWILNPSSLTWKEVTIIILMWIIDDSFYPSAVLCCRDSIFVIHVHVVEIVHDYRYIFPMQTLSSHSPLRKSFDVSSILAHT